MQDGDSVAQLVIDRYNSLPKKGKPLIRSNGVREWTILAGVVIMNTRSEKLECVSMATGVKALPDEKIRNSKGSILHDCHAEILAIRAFNLYIANEGIDHIGDIYLYVCAPPCGDASMGLMNGEDEWTRESRPKPGSLIRGRAHYNCLGHIRTKPGRGDSVTTMSKSCSDKLCLRQSRGLILSPLRRVYNKSLFLTALVCPVIAELDFERAFSRWEPEHRFKFTQTSLGFDDYHPGNGAPSPCSLLWTPGTSEVIANGILQGSKGRPSSVSRFMLAAKAQSCATAQFVGVQNYYDLKPSEGGWPPGWIRTARDDFVLPSK